MPDRQTRLLQHLAEFQRNRLEAGKQALKLRGRQGSQQAVGLRCLMGGETTPNRAVVQSACKAYRLPGQILKAQFAEGGALQLILLRFTQALMPPAGLR